MAFETILVHVDCEQSLPGQLAVAEAIVNGSRAHVIGIAAVSGLEGARTSKPVLLGDAARTAMGRFSQRLRDAFARAVQDRQLTAEWNEPSALASRPQGSIATYGRMSDLIIAGDTACRDPKPMALATLCSLVVEAGRPVIVVPQRNRQMSCGRRVLIAWNGSREAQRAAFDAVPLLRRAETVTVLQADTGRKSRAPGPTVATLCTAIRRHGVRVRSDELALPRASAGAALLSAVKAENADLLVMGCGGHWRDRTFVLGGTTHHVLLNMTVPVLMSH